MRLSAEIREHQRRREKKTFSEHLRRSFPKTLYASYPVQARGDVGFGDLLSRRQCHVGDGMGKY
jgi:hypothetical protein